MSVQGKVVWHDLMTKDVARSKAFYGELFGWKVVEQGAWAFWSHDGGNDHFGTLMPVPVEGMPSNWVPYITVDDLDAALVAIPAHGGRLHTAKMAAGTTGHFAIAADPHGATFSVWQYAAGAPKPETDTPPGAGHFCWAELHSPNPSADEKFYAAVFGYGVEHMEMPGMKYTVFLRDAKRADGTRRQGGGMMQLQAGMTHPFWLSYVAVADCDATIERAGKLGGSVIQGAMEIPNIGRMAIFADPTQAVFAVLGPNKPHTH